MLKTVTGTWFEFQHHNEAEGFYWNDLIKHWSEAQWRSYIRRMNADGMEYLVLLASALNDRAYFATNLYPPSDLRCPDPLNLLMEETEKLGMKVFMSAGYYGNWTRPEYNMADSEVTRRAFNAMEQLVEQFGQYQSFYGWYLPDETCVDGYFSEEFIAYINRYSAHMHALNPTHKMLVAPYGTRLLHPDDRYIAQLEQIDADFIAYQDEVGVRKTSVEEVPAFYEGLRRAHDKAGRSALWADIETFDFEGEVYHSPLIPAPEERIRRQIEAVSPYVDRILMYQHQLALADEQRNQK